MKKSCLIISICFLISFASLSVMAENSRTVVDNFTIVSRIEGCDIDMKQHCADVTPGKNREILCLAAHEDKLLGECRAGLIEAAMALRLGVATLDYAYEACGSDRVKVCGDVQAGEGRLLNCMKNNQSNVSPACVTALKETGIWDAIEPASGG